VSDVDKFRKVVEKLESEASTVSEFNGVLRAINDAKVAIKVSGGSLAQLTEMHTTLVSKNGKDFDNLLASFSTLDASLSRLHIALASQNNQNFERLSADLLDLSARAKTLGESLDLVSKSIDDLNFVTPKQFENGHAQMLHQLSEQESKILDHYDQRVALIEQRIASRLSVLSSEVSQQLVEQQTKIKSLRAMVVAAMVLLIPGMTFLLYQTVL
jgi:hypothetical protein